MICYGIGCCISRNITATLINNFVTKRPILRSYVPTIVSDNGLAPNRRQAIIWANDRNKVHLVNCTVCWVCCNWQFRIPDQDWDMEHPERSMRMLYRHIDSSNWLFTRKTYGYPINLFSDHTNLYLKEALGRFRTLLKHKGRDTSGCHFTVDIIKCIFLIENIFILIPISLKFVL